MENKDLKYLKEHVKEQLKKGMTTEFLEPHELKIVIPFLNKANISYQIFHLFQESEKVILYHTQKPDLTCYQVVSKVSFRHQDILGSIFSHQINKNLFGEIVMMDGNFYITILSSMKDYFTSFFTMIGNQKITLKEVPLETVSSYQYQFITKKIMVPSMRIDVVLAKLLGTSRRIVIEKMKVNEVVRNYEVVKNKALELKEGDILSIRRYGKYQIAEKEGTTKKGNQILIVKKYC